MLSKYLDMPSLLSWLAQRQHVPEGGLAGRSNKLVDGCYSHWIGGCWPLVEAACRDQKATPRLFNREALARYILCCCQGEKGGLRDKPSKYAAHHFTPPHASALPSADNNLQTPGCIPHALRPSRPQLSTASLPLRGNELHE